MSLIQEALHRKATEGGPTPPPAPSPRPSRGHPGVWILLLILLFVVSGAALWYLDPSFFVREKKPPSPSPAPLARPENTAEEMLAVSTPPAPDPPVAAAAPPAIGSAAPVTVVEPAPPPPAPPVEPAPPVSVEKAPVAAPAAPSGRQPPGEKPKEEAKATRWPAIKLTGVMVGHGEKSKGSAFLNGAFVEVGDRIEGVRLVEVDAKGVRLEFQGEKKYLRLGQSLP